MHAHMQIFALVYLKVTEKAMQDEKEIVQPPGAYPRKKMYFKNPCMIPLLNFSNFL